MNYRAFADYRKGYGHVRKGTGVEDYASAYNDPDGRFFISVICDGHSDNNCFRSNKGSQFGCESAVEVLRRYFELYFAQKPEDRIAIPDDAAIDRLKRSIKQSWDRKVEWDLKENPITEVEYNMVKPGVRDLYRAGNKLLHIFGATFLAVAVCEDFFLAIQIGDGTILCIDAQGTYYCPVQEDIKSDSGGPASLCDDDLMERPNAFRIVFSQKIPKYAAVSSDGIQDCLDPMAYKQEFQRLFQAIEAKEEEGQASDQLNDKQSRYFGSFLEHFAAEGVGAEDDTSIAAFYELDGNVPECMIPLDELIKIYNATVSERNAMIRDYDDRKQKLESNLIAARKRHETILRRMKKTTGFDLWAAPEWLESKDALERLKQTLQILIENQEGKRLSYKGKGSFLLEQLKKQTGKDITDNAYWKELGLIAPISPEEIKTKIDVDASYLDLRDMERKIERLQKEYQEEQNRLNQVKLKWDQMGNLRNCSPEELAAVQNELYEVNTAADGIVEQIQKEKEELRKLQEEYTDSEAPKQDWYRNLCPNSESPTEEDITSAEAAEDSVTTSEPNLELPTDDIQLEPVIIKVNKVSTSKVILTLNPDVDDKKKKINTDYRMM